MSTDTSNLLWFILTALFIGLIVGAIARLLVPGPTPMGLLGTAVAGIAGAIGAGIVGRLIWGPLYTPGWLASISRRTRGLTSTARLTLSTARLDSVDGPRNGIIFSQRQGRLLASMETHTT